MTYIATKDSDELLVLRVRKVMLEDDIEEHEKTMAQLSQDWLNNGRPLPDAPLHRLEKIFTEKIFNTFTDEKKISKSQCLPGDFRDKYIQNGTWYAGFIADCAQLLNQIDHLKKTIMTIKLVTLVDIDEMIGLEQWKDAYVRYNECDCYPDEYDFTEETDYDVLRALINSCDQHRILVSSNKHSVDHSKIPLGLIGMNSYELDQFITTYL